MAEFHRTEYEDFDVEVRVTDEDDLGVSFRHPDGEHHISMDFDVFREVIEFVSVHGLGMKDPYLVECDETTESANSR